VSRHDGVRWPGVLLLARRTVYTGPMTTPERDGVALTHLDEPLFDGAGATKRDLVDYLEAVSGLILPELRGRPLSVIRVRAGQQPFMQKNVPDYAPAWIRTITLWAESSRREVRYALCDDWRTLLWFANQRAVEYHPTLGLAGHLAQPSHLVLDIDPPPGGPFGQAVAAARLIRQALDEVGLAGAVKTSGSKGLHVYVPVAGASAEEAAAATRAVAVRAERLDPALATTAFIVQDRQGKVFLDSTRAFGATVAAAYSPRVRPGVPVSFPLRWEDLDGIGPGDFTVHTVPGLVAGHDAWAGQLPAPQALSDALVGEGRAIPVARVQAMHEGKRRARARRNPLVRRVPALAELGPGRRGAGQLLAVRGPHAVEDEGQVPVTQFGGAPRVGKPDRGHELEHQRDVVQRQVRAKHVADQAEQFGHELA